MFEIIILLLFSLLVGGSIAAFFIARSLLRDYNVIAQKGENPKHDIVTIHYWLRLSAKFLYPFSIIFLMYGGIRFINQVFNQMLLPFSKEALISAYDSNILFYIFLGIIGLLISIAIIKKTNETFGPKPKTEEIWNG